LFPGSIDVPTGARTPTPGDPPRRRRWPFAATAVAGVAAVGGVAAAVIASGSHDDAHFRAAVASICRLAQAQQAAYARRTRALDRALEQAETWQDSECAVYFDAQQSLRDADTLQAALLELNAPSPWRTSVTSARDTLGATTADYRAYLLRLNTAA
jgi:hypothetical protein